MKNLIFIITILFFFSNKSLSQDKVLDINKYSECRLIIPIDYKNIEENFEESRKYKEVEIILIYTNGKDKIKTIERGFIKNMEKGGKKFVFFEPKALNNSGSKTAKFPLFNVKNTFCYKAECYDKK